jgi:diguanylate cyclase (GGDEF)-like protein
MPLWKWIGSAEIVAMSGALAHQVWRTWGPPGGLSDGPRAPVAVAAAAVVFVLAEAAGLFVASRLNRLEDELVLRRHLASRSFYLTELAVLATGTVAAALIVLAPWLLPLELPTYLLLQQAVLHESLRAQARTDPKTGLLSASAWSEEAARRLRRLTSNGTPVAVVLLDLDHFKAVNDSYGHLVGDRVLVHLAQLLARQLRPGDLLGRFGGEEFCLLLHGLSRPETTELAERIRQTVASSPESQGGPAVTISAGVSWHDAPVALDDALARADEALYRSKRRGRDQVQFAEPEAVRLAPVPQLTRAG